MRIQSWSKLIALLANQHFSGIYNLASEALDAPSFGIAIPAVCGGATCFLMCHSPKILYKNLLLASKSFVLHNAFGNDAGWSSLVAREAHNLEVAGSNPAPATIRLSVY